ncbi:PqqD family protein [Streptomyces griseocarneus]|nr:PqqD family protein [Streptomyces griseocarneus]
MSLRLRRDVTTCETDEALVLLDGRNGRYWQLNPTGAAVLRALLDGQAPAAIARRLARAQPVDELRATEDVEALIRRLTAARLVEQPAEKRRVEERPVEERPVEERDVGGR